jgi:hypothetical protein
VLGQHQRAVDLIGEKAARMMPASTDQAVAA